MESPADMTAREGEGDARQLAATMVALRESSTGSSTRVARRRVEAVLVGGSHKPTGNATRALRSALWTDGLARSRTVTTHEGQGRKHSKHILHE
jgi:hypothetical protein